MTDEPISRSHIGTPAGVFNKEEVHDVLRAVIAGARQVEDLPVIAMLVLLGEVVNYGKSIRAIDWEWLGQQAARFGIAMPGK